MILNNVSQTRSVLFILFLLVPFLVNCAIFDWSGKVPSIVETRTSQEKMPQDDTLPHPIQATLIDTRNLVFTNTLPEEARMKSCEESVDEVGSQATNPTGFAKAKAVLVVTVDRDPMLHHWCFYRIVAKMDEQLQLVDKPLVEQSDLFLEQMRNLWVHAKSLDQVREVPFYFEYLQRRYIQISREQFGRTVEVIAPPLSDQYQMTPTPPLTEEASEFDD